MFDGKYTYVTTPDLIPQIAREISSAPVVGLDIETTHLKSFQGKIRLIQLNTLSGIYVLDMFRLDKEQIQPILRELAQERVIKIIANGRFEQAWFLHHYDGLELWPLFDTWRASQIIYNGWAHIPHDLWSCESRELQKRGFVRHFSEDQGGSDWSADVLTEKQLGYAAQDVGWLPELREELKAKIMADGLAHTALIEFGAVLPEAQIENTGFYLDRHKWIQLYEKNLIEERRTLEFLSKALPHPKGMMNLPGMEHIPTWNIGAPQQMAKALARMGVKIPGPDGKMYPPGATLMDDEGEEMTLGTGETLLAQVAHKYPIIDSVLEYRGYRQRVKSFGPNYLDHINDVTGRIHSSFFPFTGAGRYACSSPNLANIPRDIEYRYCFGAEEGDVLTDADYSGVEMALVAELSGDPLLTKALNDRKDPHKFTASIVMVKPESEITKDERQSAKPLNFGLCIAEGELVLTDRGRVPIEAVLNKDYVWDGVEWVQHDGVVCQGVKEVILHDGLWATPDHEVYTDDERLPFWQCASPLRPRRLAVGGVADVPVGYAHVDGESRTARAKSPVRRSDLLDVSADQMDLGGQHSWTEDEELSVHDQAEVRRRPAGRDARGALRLDGPAVRAGYAHEFASLQGARHQGALRVAGTLHSLGAGDVSGLGFQGPLLRSQGQQWALRAGEPSLGDVCRELGQQGLRRFARVYDLVNAGPRHRFTVEGRVVSNCYGMMPDKLQMYAKAQYKVTLSDREARTFHRRYFDAYKGIAAWHAVQLRDGKRMGEVRTIGGRRRYVSETDHNSLINTPSQGSGADGLKAALRNVFFRLKKIGSGVKGIVHHVHDELLVQHKDDPELTRLVQKAVSEGMEEAMRAYVQTVPVIAEAGTGKTWGEAK